MREMRLGHVLFASSFAAIGVLSLISGDFALVWQPVPPGIPGREALAYASGVMLLGCGLGMLLPRAARLATFILTLNLVVWLFLLRLPPVLAKPTNEGNWLGLGETLMQVTGGWILLASLPAAAAGPRFLHALSARGTRLPRLLFAAALIPVGLSHFFYLSGTAEMVPAWLPFRAGWAGFTGAAHIAAGLALLVSILPHLAAKLEAIMISLFTLLVCAAGVVATPSVRFAWTAFCISAAMAGAAWAVAGSLQPAER